MADVKKWAQEHKLFLGVLGALGAWAAVGELAHHKVKMNVIREMEKKLPPGSRVLNVGCKRLLLPREAGWEVTNLDIVPRDVPNFVQEDMRDLSIFDNNSFDAIFVSHALEHIPLKDVEIAIGEFRRIVKDPSNIYMVVPLPYVPSAWLSVGHKWVKVGNTYVSNPNPAAWGGLTLLLCVSYLPKKAVDLVIPIATGTSIAVLDSVNVLDRLST